MVAERTKDLLIDRDKYDTIRSIYQMLLRVPEDQRLAELEKQTSDPEIREEVLSLLKHTKDETIIATRGNTILKKAMPIERLPITKKG